MARQHLRSLDGAVQGSVQGAVRKALMQSKLVSAEVPIELGGKTRQLCLNMNAMCRIEEETGVSVISGAGELFNQISAGKIRTIVWAMLADELERDEPIDEPRLLSLLATGMDGERAHNRVYQELVGRWVTVANVEELIEKMNLAFTRAMPEPDPSESPEGTARKNVKGSASTGS